MGLGLSAVLGFVPAFLCAVLLYWLDRYEKEPKRLLGAAFVWGAVFAAGIAVIAQVALQAITVQATGSPPLASVAGATLFAPLTEELLKGAAVLFVFVAFRSEFDSLLDGIVYSGTVALGFAATENTLYIYSGYRADGGEGLLAVFIARVVFGIWDHPFYTAFFGMGLAISRLHRERAVRLLAPVGGLIVGFGAHALHNALSVLFAEGFVFLVLLIDWIGWAFLALVIISAARSEGALIGQELLEERDAGVISAPQLATAASSLRRVLAVWRSLRHGRSRSTRRFYAACAELAHKKHQLRRVGDEGGNLRRITELRAQLGELSPVAVT